MKNLIYIILISIPIINVHSQEVSDTVFTSEQVLKIGNYIDSLENELLYINKKLELTEKLAEQYKISNLEMSELLSYNEKHQSVRDAQYNLLESSVQSYQKYIKENKRPFWDKPLVWFLVGAGTIYFSSTIVANIK
jgi:signal recognition particle GTPase